MAGSMSERSERELPSLAPPTAAPLHPRSFKLRFASQCEPGRSHVSAFKPLALPATVTDKLHRRQVEALPEEPLRRVQDMFRRGPRDKFQAPVTSSHEYGWWATYARGTDSEGSTVRLNYHIRDSAWLKSCIRVLAADAGYKR